MSCITPKWKIALKKVPGVIPLTHIYRMIGNSSYRSEWLIKQEKPHNLFQPVSQTSFDRYPRIFAFVKAQLAEVAAPRLLSFGCSTGEEAFTLRKYFPTAEITGIDINPRSIARCSRKLAQSGDTQIRFELAGSSSDEPDSHYDAIFCMAVLRHGELGATLPENCSHLIRFEDFEKTVADLCRILKSGGYLIIRHSNFRFSDTATAASFDTVLSVEFRSTRTYNPIYNSDNQRLRNAYYDETVFCKRTTQQQNST